MISPRRSLDQDKFGAIWQFAVGLALCGGSLYLVHLINRWTIRADNAFLRELFVLLNQYHGKWVLAALVAALGAAFCYAAMRRMQIAQEMRPFTEGAMLLESTRWMSSASEDGSDEPKP